MTIDRDTFLQEQTLRLHIRKAIKISARKKKVNFLTENRLRQNIRKLLKEVAVEDKVPHHSTGINFLEDLLKKIVPILEDDYKILTTDAAQRKSFRAHVINAVQNALAPGKSRARAGEEDAGKMISTANEELTEAPEDGLDMQDDPEIEIDIGDDMDGPTDASSEIEAGIADDPGQFIDIDNDGVQQKQADTFSLPGEELTGRNAALSTFEKIEKNIVDTYGGLANEEDKSLFYDYLLTNLKLYFDKFEDELQPALEEPSTEEYEDEKEVDVGSDEDPVGSEDLDTLAEGIMDRVSSALKGSDTKAGNEDIARAQKRMNELMADLGLAYNTYSAARLDPSITSGLKEIHKAVREQTKALAAIAAQIK